MIVDNCGVLAAAKKIYKMKSGDCVIAFLFVRFLTIAVVSERKGRLGGETIRVSLSKFK